MIVQGDISGIHDFVTNISEGGGGQAKRLRARSFYSQLLCEAALVRVCEVLGWPIDADHLVMSAAGHFVLKGESPVDAADKLEQLHRQLNEWLLSHLQGEVRISLGWSESGDDDLDQFRNSYLNMGNARLRAFGPVVCTESGWNSEAMILPPIDTPCVLCRQRPGIVNEIDIDRSIARTICSLCDQLKRFGRAMTEPKRQWLTIKKFTGGNLPDHSVEAFGLIMSLDHSPPNPQGVLACTNLKEAPFNSPGGPFERKWIRRRLGRHIPVNSHLDVLDFSDLAGKSTGDHKLGVMKADGDGMGEFWSRLVVQMKTLQDYGLASGELDKFSSESINALAQKHQWIYTVFSGGDDLLFIGPWDLILEFAGEVQEEFQKCFSHYGPTLSAGIAIARHDWPVRRMVSMAEELLEQAKQIPARGANTPRNQVATLGEIWSWRDHKEVISDGKQWASWVQRKYMERGTLRTIMEMSEARYGNRDSSDDRTNKLMADARLDYILERRLPPGRPVRSPGPGAMRDRPIDPAWQEMQNRIRELKAQFEKPSKARERYLSASLQYAILATRTSREG